MRAVRPYGQQPLSPSPTLGALDKSRSELPKNRNDASIRFKAIEQVTSLSAAEETSRAVRRSFPSRHGRRVFRSADFYANAI